MRTHISSLLTLAVLIVGSPVLASPSRTMHWVERAENEHVVDMAPAGDSRGDLLVFVNPLFDSANKSSVGSSNGYCVRTNPGKAWQCIWTMQFADGQLAVSGVYEDEGDSTFIITGGTGTFTGVRGTLKLHSRDAKNSAYDFIATLQ